MSFQDSLTAAGSETDSNQKSENYQLLLNDALSRKSSDDLKLFVSEMLNEKTPLFVSRALLHSFADGIKALSNDLQKEIALFALETAQSRVVAFEEQISKIRENLATVYTEEEDYIEAARTLIGIPLDSGQRMLEPKYKVDIYVRISQLYLEEEESVEAERYLNRASELIHLVKDKALQLKYRGAFVRVLDFKRQFLKAALKYYQMSQDQLLDDHSQIQALDAAHKCAILAEAGPQRQRLLATLYKDERSSKAETFGMLEKMYLDRIITQKEVTLFAQTLQDHQLAKLGDGSTVLDRAVVEHNILSASQLYQNIGFDQLAALLEVDSVRAEKIAAKMMMENRLNGSIDQVARMIEFQTTLEESNALAQWDGSIRRVCNLVNDVLESVAAQNPDTYQQLLAVSAKQ